VSSTRQECVLHAVHPWTIALESCHVLCGRQRNDAQALLSQPTAHTSASENIFCRWYSRAGFAIWHPKSWWPVFCRQGSSAANAKLGQLLLSQRALTAHNDLLVAKADSGGDCFMSPSQPAQEKQDLTASREDIVSLIQAMYSQFEGRDLASVDTPGFGTFGGIALAFGLPHIHEDILKSKLRVSAFAVALAVISVLHKPCCCVCYCRFRSIACFSAYQAHIACVLHTGVTCPCSMGCVGQPRCLAQLLHFAFG